MLMPLTRRKTSWAAYCDACLIGSPAFTFDAPPLARSWAINKLRALGWVHLAGPGLPAQGRALAEASWTGETYCFECANNAKMRVPRAAAS